MDCPDPTTVMVVDDDPVVLRACMRELAALGLRVVTSESPIGVSAMVRQHRPCVIVLDLNMPAIPGERLADLLMTAGGEIPAIIFYSGVAATELEELWKQGRCTNYVTKGEGFEALASTVLRYVVQARSRRSGSFRLAL